MSSLPLIKYESEAEYKAHYFRVYCSGPILTHDGVVVRFRKSKFEHAFFESTNRDGKKDQFSHLRAEKIDWIRAALKNSKAEMYVGWNRKKKCCDKNYRVTIVVENYVVIIRFTSPTKAEFVTAYVADSSETLEKIKSGPKW